MTDNKSNWKSPIAMRYLYFFTIFLASLSLRSEELQGLSEFTQTVTDACKKHDLSIIRQCSCDVGVPKDILDESRISWTRILSGKYPEEGWVFEKASFIPLEVLKQQAKATEREKVGVSDVVKQAMDRAEQQRREIVEQMTKPIIRNGQPYEYNLKVVGFLVLNFSNGTSQTGRAMPIGMDSTGKIRFTSLKPRDG